MSTPLTETLPNGAVLDGYYEITHYIGSGGFADVYAGRQLDTGMDIAIKIMKPINAPQSVQTTFKKRFLQEAQLAASIQHPNVVTILACRQDVRIQNPNHAQPSPTDGFYIVMELLKGHDLDDELRQNGPMTPPRALRLMLGCLDGLAQGHAADIIHKDLKPSNLFLTNPGSRVESLKILDYGIARAGQNPDEKLTLAGQAVFTPQYAAPEYIDTLTATPALDVYQMGLVLTEMLTGVPVVEHETVYSCMMAHASGIELPSIIIDSPLGPILTKATAKNHHDRYPNAAAFAEALETVQDKLPNTPLASHTPSIDPLTHTLDPSHSVDTNPPPITANPTLDPQQPPVPTHAHSPKPLLPTPNASPSTPAKPTTVRENLAELPPLPPITPNATAATSNNASSSRPAMVAAALLATAFGVLAMLALVALGTAFAMGWIGKDPVTAALDSCDNPKDCYDNARDLEKGRNGADKNLQAATALYKRACGNNEPRACQRMAIITATSKTPEGKRAAQDDAFKWSLQACQHGDESICINLARKYNTGKDFKKSARRAGELYQMACESKDSPKACLGQGKVHSRTQGQVDKNRTKALDAYQKACILKELDDCFDLFKDACRDGSDATCRLLAEAYLIGGTQPPNADRAWNLHKISASKDDDGENTYQLSIHYKNGTSGISKHLGRSAELNQLACDHKHANSCVDLGFNYERGQGVLKDDKLAIKYYKKACKLEAGLGCNNLAIAHRNGLGTKASDKKAVEFFKRSCKLNYMGGCNNLGFMYEKGRGVTADIEKAVKLYRQACDGGDMLGCSNLGVMYELGTGVPKDTNQAARLYRKACDGGNSNGCKNIKNVSP